MKNIALFCALGISYFGFADNIKSENTQVSYDKNEVNAKTVECSFTKTNVKTVGADGSISISVSQTIKCDTVEEFEALTTAHGG